MVPSSNDLLRLAQQSTGKRQKMILALLQLQLLWESGENLHQDQRASLQMAIEDLYAVVPPKREPEAGASK